MIIIKCLSTRSICYFPLFSSRSDDKRGHAANTNNVCLVLRLFCAKTCFSLAFFHFLLEVSGIVFQRFLPPFSNSSLCLVYVFVSLLPDDYGCIAYVCKYILPTEQNETCVCMFVAILLFRYTHSRHTFSLSSYHSSHHTASSFACF